MKQTLLVMGLGFQSPIPNVLYTGGLDIVVTYLYPLLPHESVIFVRALNSPRTISFNYAKNVHVHAVPVERWRSKDDRMFRVAEHSFDMIDAFDFVSTVVYERVLPLMPLMNRKNLILHAHDWMNAKAITILKEEYPDIKSVFSVHISVSRPVGVDYLELLKEIERHGLSTEVRARLGSLDRRLLLEAEGCENADIVHCVSKATAESVINAYGIPRKKVKVIYNGVDTNLYTPPTEADTERIATVLKKYGITKPFILSTGRFVAEKNHKGLLKAFQIFAEKNQDYSLAILGFDGYTYDELVKIREAMPENIRKRVVIRSADLRQDLPLLYRAADICCFPSTEEAFGIVALEAMASGSPVVVGDVGGLREVVDDSVNRKVGVRVDARSPELLAKALSEAVANRKTWGANARKYVVKKFSWKKIALKFQRLYESLA
ncbi:MAG: glycosyltransferase [Candidatus Hadarchaeales archaeon]